jgi:hypothetical protein
MALYIPNIRGRIFQPQAGRRALAYPFAASPPRTIPNCVLAMVPAWTYNHAAQTTGVMGTTAADTIGSTVGQTDDYSTANHFISAIVGSTATLATPTTTSGQSVAFGFDGSNSILFVENSKKSFKSMWGTGVGTIAIWIEPTSVTGTGQILNNNDDVEAKPGIMLRRDTTGLMFKLCKNSNGTIGERSLTSVLSANVGGWCIVRFNGNGSTGKMRFAGGADSTFSIDSSRFVTNDAEYNLAFGAKTASSSQKFAGNIGPCLLFARSISDAECSTIEAWKPTITSQCPYSYTSGSLLTATGIRCAFPLHDSAYLSTGTDRTSLVAPTNGQGVKLAVNYTSQALGVDLNRDMASAGATDPVYTTGVITSPCIRFNNGVTTDDLRMAAHAAVPSRHHTHIVVVRNLDATYGSHTIRRNGSLLNYYTVVGSSYHTGTNPRTSYHDSAGGGPGGSGIRGESSFNSLVVTKDATAYVEYANGSVIATATASTAMPWNAIGGNNATSPDTTSWALDGYVTEVYELPFTMSPSQVSAFVSYVESTRGIS